MRDVRFVWAAALCIALGACGGAGGKDDSPHVTISGSQAIATTDLGQMKGLASKGVLSFRGIRFGQSTAADLRWKPPVATGPWSGVLDATNFGNICPQGNTVDPSASEDCLFLNVYAPASVAAGTRNLPVMFWIHGGANASGSSSDYDPSRLVSEQNVIVVSTNYRVGVLGFLAHPAIDSEGHPAANYGLLDQQLSLKWVQKNIQAFGGDPKNVTVFGASSGGLDILNHLVAPSSSGLFQKAVVQSGAYQPFTPSLQDSETRGIAFAQRLGCANGSAACLRGKALADVLANQGSTNSASSAFNQSTIDGTTLTQTQRAALLQGKFQKVPVMQGVTRYEGRAIPSETPDSTPAQYQAVAAAYAAADARSANEVTTTYPLAGYPSPFEAASAIVTDAAFSCPALQTNLALASQTPVYAYEFDEATTEVDSSGHYADVQYLFDVPWANKAGTDIGTSIRQIFAQFARTGTPDGGTTTDWQSFTGRGRYIRLIGATSQQQAGFEATHHCDFWGANSGIPVNSRF